MTGPIGKERLMVFAMTRTFRISDTRPAIAPAHCKVCGAALAGRQNKDKGHEVTVIAEYIGSAHGAFFCTPCFRELEDAWKKAREWGFVKPLPIHSTPGTPPGPTEEK